MKPAEPSKASCEPTTPQVDPSAWVDRHGDALYRYALIRVRRSEVAEDLVQETLLAGLRSKHRFKGDSAERTWLTGILRHKIVDHFRSRSRGKDGVSEESHSDWLDDLFDDKGRWRKPPDPDALQPDVLLERREFWDVFDDCLDDLPARAREALVRRVMEQEATTAICKALDVTATNLGVILFRARTQMRRCLMLKWFGDAGAQEAEPRGRASR